MAATAPVAVVGGRVGNLEPAARKVAVGQTAGGGSVGGSVCACGLSDSSDSARRVGYRAREGKVRKGYVLGRRLRLTPPPGMARRMDGWADGRSGSGAGKGAIEIAVGRAPQPARNGQNSVENGAGTAPRAK